MKHSEARLTAVAYVVFINSDPDSGVEKRGNIFATRHMAEMEVEMTEGLALGDARIESQQLNRAELSKLISHQLTQEQFERWGYGYLAINGVTYL